MKDFWNGFICGFANIFGHNSTVSYNSSLRYKISKYLTASMQYYKKTGNK